MNDFDFLLEQCAKAEEAFLAADAALEANPSDDAAQAAFDAAEAAFDAARAAYDACAKAMMAEAAAESEQSPWVAALASYERDAHYQGEGLPTHVAARGVVFYDEIPIDPEMRARALALDEIPK